MANKIQSIFKIDETQPIILLDVDETLIINRRLNNNLIEALIASNNPNLFLFTNMCMRSVLQAKLPNIYGLPEIALRYNLIDEMEKKGLPIKCVITPGDVNYERIGDHYLNVLEPMERTRSREINQLEIELVSVDEKSGLNPALVNEYSNFFRDKPDFLKNIGKDIDDKTKVNMFAKTFSFFKNNWTSLNQPNFIFIDDQSIQLFSVALESIRLNSNVYFQRAIDNNRQAYPTHIYKRALDFYLIPATDPKKLAEELRIRLLTSIDILFKDLYISLENTIDKFFDDLKTIHIYHFKLYLIFLLILREENIRLTATFLTFDLSTNFKDVEKSTRLTVGDLLQRKLREENRSFLPTITFNSMRSTLDRLPIPPINTVLISTLKNPGPLQDIISIYARASKIIQGTKPLMRLSGASGVSVVNNTHRVTPVPIQRISAMSQAKSQANNNELIRAMALSREKPKISDFTQIKTKDDGWCFYNSIIMALKGSENIHDSIILGKVLGKLFEDEVNANRINERYVDHLKLSYMDVHHHNIEKLKKEDNNLSAIPNNLLNEKNKNNKQKAITKKKKEITELENITLNIEYILKAIKNSYTPKDPSNLNAGPIEWPEAISFSKILYSILKKFHIGIQIYTQDTQDDTNLIYLNDFMDGNTKYFINLLFIPSQNHFNYLENKETAKQIPKELKKEVVDVIGSMIKVLPHIPSETAEKYLMGATASVPAAEGPKAGPAPRTVPAAILTPVPSPRTVPMASAVPIPRPTSSEEEKHFKMINEDKDYGNLIQYLGDLLTGKNNYTFFDFSNLTFEKKVEYLKTKKLSDKIMEQFENFRDKYESVVGPISSTVRLIASTEPTQTDIEIGKHKRMMDTNEGYKDDIKHLINIFTIPNKYNKKNQTKNNQTNNNTTIQIFLINKFPGLSFDEKVNYLKGEKKISHSFVTNFEKYREKYENILSAARPSASSAARPSASIRARPSASIRARPSVSAEKPLVAAQLSDWDCSQCTLTNPGKERFCEACLSPKPNQGGGNKSSRKTKTKKSKQIKKTNHKKSKKQKKTKKNLKSKKH